MKPRINAAQYMEITYHGMTAKRFEELYKNDADMQNTFQMTVANSSIHGYSVNFRRHVTSNYYLKGKCIEDLQHPKRVTDIIAEICKKTSFQFPNSQPSTLPVSPTSKYFCSTGKEAEKILNEYQLNPDLKETFSIQTENTGNEIKVTVTRKGSFYLHNGKLYDDNLEKPTNKLFNMIAGSFQRARNHKSKNTRVIQTPQDQPLQNPSETVNTRPIVPEQPLQTDIPTINPTVKQEAEPQTTNDFENVIKLFDDILDDVKKEGSFAAKTASRISTKNCAPYHRIVTKKLNNLIRILELADKNQFDSAFVSNKSLACIHNFLKVNLTFTQFSTVVDIWLNIQKMQGVDEAENVKILKEIKNALAAFPSKHQDHIKSRLPVNISIDETIVTQPEIIDLTEDYRPSLVEQNRVVPDFKVTEREVPKYDVSDINAIKKLIDSFPEDQKFEYDINANKANLEKKKIRLFIAPLYVVPGQYAVYTADDIPEDLKEELAHYVGTRNLYEENPDSLYIFELLDKNGEMIAIIDGLKLRDFSSWFNQSVQGNLDICQKNEKTITHMCFYAAHNIDKGMQLLFDYGKEYWIVQGYDPYYLHPTDNWKSPEELHCENISHYETNLFRFDTTTCNALKLFKGDWVIPKLFRAIINNDDELLDVELSRSTPVDILAYACHENEMAATSAQQHLTPLMLACYFGNENAIEKLIANGADVNRCMLIDGLMPLTCLLLGKNDKEMVQRIGSKLLKKMFNPFILDKQRLGLLHYMIAGGHTQLVKEFLKIAKKKNQNIFDIMFARNKEWRPYADFDYCILHDKLDILKLLLTSNKKIKKLIQEYITGGLILKDETFELASLSQLQNLHELLKNKACFMMVKRLNVLERIEQHIANKTAAPSQLTSQELPQEPPPREPQANDIAIEAGNSLENAIIELEKEIAARKTSISKAGVSLKERMSNISSLPEDQKPEYIAAIKRDLDIHKQNEAVLQQRVSQLTDLRKKFCDLTQQSTMMDLEKEVQPDTTIRADQKNGTETHEITIKSSYECIKPLMGKLIENYEGGILVSVMITSLNGIFDSIQKCNVYKSFTRNYPTLKTSFIYIEPHGNVLLITQCKDFKPEIEKHLPSILNILNVSINKPAINKQKRKSTDEATETIHETKKIKNKPPGQALFPIVKPSNEILTVTGKNGETFSILFKKLISQQDNIVQFNIEFKQSPELNANISNLVRNLKSITHGLNFRIGANKEGPLRIFVTCSSFGTVIPMNRIDKQMPAIKTAIEKFLKDELELENQISGPGFARGLSS